MKQHSIFIALMAMVAIGFTACTKSELTEVGNSNGKSVTINASIVEPATRVAFKEEDTKLNMYWRNEANKEKFSLYGSSLTVPSGVYLFTKSTATTFAKVASFTCAYAPSISEGTTVYAFYPGKGDILSDSKTITFDLRNQPGIEATDTSTTANVGNYNVMLAQATVPASGLDAVGFHFEHKVALVKMTLGFPEGVAGPVSQISINSPDIHNQGKLSISEGTWSHTSSQTGSISTKSDASFELDAERKVTAWLAVFPEALEDVTITAKAGDYVYIVNMPEITFASSKVYTVDKTMARKTNLKSVYSEKDFYRWDAYCDKSAPLGSIWEQGSSAANMTVSSASASCKDSPTYDQIEMYLGAGVYYFNPAEGGIPTGMPTYSTVTDPEVKARPGFWLMKKEYISGFDTGTASHEYSANHTNGVLFHQGCPETIQIHKYFFLPMLGYYHTSGFLVNEGSVGVFGLNTPANESEAYALILSPEEIIVEKFFKNHLLLPMVLE